MKMETKTGFEIFIFGGCFSHANREGGDQRFDDAVKCDVTRFGASGKRCRNASEYQMKFWMKLF